MDINVKERKFSFTAEYDIAAPDCRYYARRAFFSFNDKLTLQDESGRQLARICGFFSPFLHRHEFFFADGRVYRFHCEKLWKRVFLCVGADGFYRLYEHKGLRFSILRNDRQVAAIAKNRIALLKGNTYEIRMDHDADLVLILCLILTLNSIKRDNNDGTVSIDFGNPFEDRPFDASWEPR